MAFLIATACMRASAEIHPDPDDKFDNVFVGKYGEVVSFRKNMSVRVQTPGDMEVVDFYLKERYQKGGFVHFDPATVKLTPEVFAREDLIQMIVAPIGASQFQNLADLRAAKEAELRTEGAEFIVLDTPYPMGDFTEGSFEVRTEKPYRLTQLYTQTPTHRFILTARRDRPGGDYFDRYYGDVRVSLAMFVSKSRKAEIRQAAPSRATPDQYIHHEAFLWLRDWVFFQAVVLLLAALMQWAPSFPRLRWSVTGFFIAASAGSLLAWVLGKGFVLSPVLSRHWFGPAALACLLLLLPFNRVMERLSTRKISRSGLILLSLYALAILFCGWSLQEKTPEVWLPLIPLYSFIMGGAASAPIGLVWGLSSHDEVKS